MSISAAKANLDVVADLVSVNRNIINGATQGSSVALPFLTALQGVLAFLSGAYTAATSFWETRQAVIKKDEQGKVLGTLSSRASYTPSVQRYGFLWTTFPCILKCETES